MTLQVFGGGGVSQAAVDASVAAKKTLTDYQNVVVVDAGGSGDYTTLKAAHDAIVAVGDASATNRYALLIFGRSLITNFTWSLSYTDVFGFGAIIGAATAQTITFTNTGLVTINTLTLEANVILSASTNAQVTVRNCTAGNSISASGAGAVVNIYNSSLSRCNVSNATAVSQVFDSTVTFSSACTVSGTLRLFNSTITISGGGYFNLLAATSVLEMNNSTLTASGSGGGIVMAANSTLRTRGGQVDAKYGQGVAALQIVTPVTVSCTGTYFKGDTGLAVAADASFTNAPFFFCVFEGGTTNITCLAGTANGSSLSF